MSASFREAVADSVFRRGEYVDSLASDIERMRLTGEQAVQHLRLVAQMLREQSDKAMQERAS